jgi:hypothetical protein
LFPEEDTTVLWLTKTFERRIKRKEGSAREAWKNHRDIIGKRIRNMTRQKIGREIRRLWERE